MSKLDDIVARRRAEIDAQTGEDPFAGQGREDRIRQLAQKDRAKAFLFFCVTYLPEYFGTAFGTFHRRLARDYTRTDQTFVLVAAPPEHGKTIMLIAYYIFAGVVGDRHMIAHLSETKDIAKIALSLVRLELLGNARIVADFGNLEHPEFREEEFFAVKNVVLPGRQQNAHPFTAYRPFGHKVQMKGWVFFAHRIDMVGMDDFEPLAASRNPKIVAQRKKWIFSEVRPRVRKGGVIVWIHNNARKKSCADKLHQAVKEGTAEEGVISRRYPAIRNGRPLWPERYTLKDLQAISRRVGRSAWRGDYLQQPIVSGKRFKAEWFVTYRPHELPDDVVVVGRLDPSLSAKGDFKALAILGFSPSKLRFYVLPGTFCKRTTINQMIEACYIAYEMWRAKGLTSIKCEAAFRQDLIYGPNFDTVAERHGYRVPVGWWESKVNKQDRIARLEDPMELGLILWPEGYERDPNMNEIVNQLLEWTGSTSDTDDGPDALEAAYSALEPRAQRARRAETTADLAKRLYRIPAATPERI